MAHVLVAGTTGSGKTALARTIVASLAMHNSQRYLQVVLIDPKGRGFLPLQGLPHLLGPVVTRADRAQPCWNGWWPRWSAGTRRGAPSRAWWSCWTSWRTWSRLAGGRWKALTRLAQRGREAGIHLVACTQKPAAAVIGGLVKSNFPVRLVGSVASPEDAKVATGMAGTGAERLLGQGDFWWSPRDR